MGHEKPNKISNVKKIKGTSWDASKTGITSTEANIVQLSLKITSRVYRNENIGFELVP